MNKMHDTEKQAMKTATFIRNLNWQGAARLYRLNPAWVVGSYGKEPQKLKYVVVSAVVVPFSGPETYIFGVKSIRHADEKIQIDWMDLPGSFRGDLDHSRALRNAGYEIVEGKHADQNQNKEQKPCVNESCSLRCSIESG